MGVTKEEAIESLEAQRDCIILSCRGGCHGGKECDECDFMYAKGTMGTMRQALDMAITALKECRWIPVTERLPEDNEVYPVTVKRKGTHINALRFNKYTWKDFNVTAWMDIKPYEGSETDAECRSILSRMVHKGAMTKEERDKILRNLRTDTCENTGEEYAECD